MKSKLLPLFIALLSLVAFLFYLGTRSEKESIRSVLSADRENGRRVSSQMGLLDKAWNPSDKIGEIVDGMRRIDLSGCPEDFKTAYIAHTEAWVNLQTVAGRNSGMNGFIKGFFNPLSVGDVYHENVESQEQVKSTWNAVLLSAQRHGVYQGNQ